MEGRQTGGPHAISGVAMADVSAGARQVAAPLGALAAQAVWQPVVSDDPAALVDLDDLAGPVD
ncbi:hypothetical protein [Ruegeria sp. AD91A]|uniref:hypothetical protein n=1 Tax=Ruegeria sp. AD91A TaxID=2293862 RepID=UPI0013C2E3FD|nr:hypothetical protein [Ruegeria sp. AD91A]